MTQKERATFVINTLKDLYPTIPIPLDHKDPYTLLIAVLLSAQCTDVRVNLTTPHLFAKATIPMLWLSYPLKRYGKSLNLADSHR